MSKIFIVDGIAVEISNPGTSTDVTLTIPEGMHSGAYAKWLADNRDALTMLKEGTPIDNIKQALQQVEAHELKLYYQNVFGHFPNYPVKYAARRIERALKRISVADLTGVI